MLPLVQRIEPTDLAPKPGYSQVMLVNPGVLAFIAGQLPEDEKGQIVGVGDLNKQTEQVFHNLDIALKAIGSDWRHVIKFTLYMRNLADISVFRSVRDRYIQVGHQPACTSVEVSRFHDERFLITLEAIASAPPQ